MLIDFGRHVLKSPWKHFKRPVWIRSVALKDARVMSQKGEELKKLTVMFFLHPRAPCFDSIFVGS